MKVNGLAYGRPESEWDELGDACLDSWWSAPRSG
jgi:hypothetical protein